MPTLYVERKHSLRFLNGIWWNRMKADFVVYKEIVRIILNTILTKFRIYTCGIFWYTETSFADSKIRYHRACVCKHLTMMNLYLNNAYKFSIFGEIDTTVVCQINQYCVEYSKYHRTNSSKSIGLLFKLESLACTNCQIRRFHSISIYSAILFKIFFQSALNGANPKIPHL